MAERTKPFDTVHLLVNAGRLLFGDVYAGAQLAIRYRKQVIGIVVGGLLFITIMASVFVNFPGQVILAIAADNKQPLDSVEERTNEAERKFNEKLDNLIDEFKSTSTADSTKSKITGKAAALDPIAILILANVEKGSIDLEEGTGNIDEDTFTRISNLFNTYTPTIDRTESEKTVVVNTSRLRVDAEGNPVYDSSGRPIYDITSETVVRTVVEETLDINIQNHSFQQAIDKMDFTEEQRSLALNMYGMYQEYPSYYFIGKEKLPEEMSEEVLVQKLSDPAMPILSRTGILELARSQVNNVPYFWGGKSTSIGRDPAWSSWLGGGWNILKMRKVTAPGSSSTGAIRPYGLDCSGFVAWVYHNAGYDVLLGGGTMFQWQQTYAIYEDELQPGDLVFENSGLNSNNHVGIYAGQDTAGKKIFIHCAPYVNGSTGRNGVMQDSYSRFRYYRRVIARFTD